MTEDLMTTLVQAVREAARIPVEVDLWDTAVIALYMKRKPAFIREQILPCPTFPAPIRLPSEGRAHALYRAKEVIEWANSHQERKSA